MSNLKNNNGEEPKRLAPSAETLKSLYLKSGNKCAYGGCSAVMQIDDTKVGEVCHMEDALPGDRWNPDRSNEENRREENLILLCHKHHKITGNVAEYSVDDLQWIKRKHELCVAEGVDPTVVSIGGAGDVVMYDSNITGGAKVNINGSGNKFLAKTNIDGGNNKNLSSNDLND